MESEYSVKLRLEKLPRSKLFMTSCVMVLVFVLSIILAEVAAPNLMRELSVSIYKCSDTKHRDCYTPGEVHEIWEAIIPNVNRFNQFLYMSVIPHSSQNIEFNMSMEIEVLNYNQVLQKGTKNKRIECRSQSCGSVAIFYLPYLKYDSYNVTIRHKSPILADDVKIDLLQVSEGFTKYQLGTKYAFFVLSVLIFSQFVVYTTRIPRQLWSFECKLLFPLGISLIIFNEPLLILTIYFMSPFWSAFSVFSNTQFLAVLLFIWFFELHHYRNSKFNKIFLILETIAILVLFSLSFTIYLYLHEELRNNPTYDWQHDLSLRYEEIFISIIVLCSILIVWILILTVLACTQIQTLSSREKIIKILSLLMIIFTFCGVFIGAFQALPRNSSLFLVFLSGFNLYVFSLLYLYSPTYESILEYRTEKNIEYSLIKFHEEEDSIELT